MAFSEEHIPFKIIGVGNPGRMVVDGLLAEGFDPCDCVLVGGGLQPWKESRCPIKIDLAESVPARGLDGANDPAWCREATMSCAEAIRGALDGSKLNIIVRDGWRDRKRCRTDRRRN